MTELEFHVIADIRCLHCCQGRRHTIIVQADTDDQAILIAVQMVAAVFPPAPHHFQVSNARIANISA